MSEHYESEQDRIDHERYVANFKPRKIWNMWEHQVGWGHNVYFGNWEERRITGHHPNSHDWQKGDEVRQKMQSGQVARFEIIEVKHLSDPNDMFFATLKDIGYVNE